LAAQEFHFLVERPVVVLDVGGYADRFAGADNFRFAGDAVAELALEHCHDLLLGMAVRVLFRARRVAVVTELQALAAYCWPLSAVARGGGADAFQIVQPVECHRRMPVIFSAAANARSR